MSLILTFRAVQICALTCMVACTSDHHGQVHSFDMDGVARIESVAPGEHEVRIDFGECVLCKGEVDLTCTTSVDGDKIEVTAFGTVDTTVCESWDECWTVQTDRRQCDPPTIAAGVWNLVYGEETVEVELPTSRWVCTGLTPIL